MNSKSQKLLIENIEDLPVSIMDKFSILLTFLSIKPASLICINSDFYRHGEPKLKISAEQLKNLKKKLKILGLRIRLTKSTEIPSGEDGQRQRFCQSRIIYAARERDVLDRIYQAHNNSPMDHYMIGILLGYPETAAKAFVEKELIENSKIPEEKYRYLAQMAARRFSKDHYPDELEEFIEWLVVAKKYSPYIYKKMIKHFYGIYALEQVEKIIDIQ